MRVPPTSLHDFIAPQLPEPVPAHFHPTCRRVLKRIPKARAPLVSVPDRENLEIPPIHGLDLSLPAIILN
jgi:hypothetical protein